MYVEVYAQESLDEELINATFLKEQNTKELARLREDEHKVISAVDIGNPTNSGLQKYMVTLAESQAIDDCVYALSQAVSKNTLPVSSYIKVSQLLVH